MVLLLGFHIQVTRNHFVGGVQRSSSDHPQKKNWRMNLYRSMCQGSKSHSCQVSRWSHVSRRSALLNAVCMSILSGPVYKLASKPPLTHRFMLFILMFLVKQADSLELWLTENPVKWGTASKTAPRERLSARGARQPDRYISSQNVCPQETQGAQDL